MKNEVEKIKNCRICASTSLKKFLDLGKMPIPNGFLTVKDLRKKEKLYNLACLFCENCSLVQLTEVVDPEIMFRKYIYIPSVSKAMMNNFANLSFYSHNKLSIGQDSFVVDIGSNDGSLLKFFKNYEARVLGIDPAENLAQVAKLNGIPTEIGLFDRVLTKKVVKEYGKADLITATNVVAHINNLDELFENLKLLLKNNGIFITEFPYILDLITKNQFDTIYHEHLSYFGLKSWDVLLKKHGFEIVDVMRLHIHGGSLRIVHKLNPTNKIKKNKTVDYLIKLEGEYGLNSPQIYDKFQKSILNLKSEMNSLLIKLKKQGKRIGGLGAPAKGNVLTSFFNIGPETLDYLVDSTSYKQGLFTPLKHIPIYPEERILKDLPDYGLILAWNFAEEIMEKHKEFKKQGGKFIIPIPEIKII